MVTSEAIFTLDSHQPPLPLIGQEALKVTLRMGWLWRVGRAYDPHLNGHWITVDTLMALNKELICTSHWEELSEAEAVF